MLEKLKTSSLREKALRPFLININPNYISFLALISAIMAGYFLWQTSLLLGAVFVALNGFFDLLDGEIAKKFNRETKLGDFVDHTIDRLSDMVILLGLTFNPTIPDWLGYTTIIVVLLVSYLGTQAQAISGKRLYAGLFGRADRIGVLTLAPIVAVFYPLILEYSLWLIFVLSIFSFIHRLFLTVKILK